MRRLWVAVALAPLSFAASAVAAPPTISDAETNPVRTSTANNGSPSDVTITSSGSLRPTSNAAPAVTIDSSNNVTNNGLIAFTGINGATGIRVDGGATGEIINAGTISIGETTTGHGTNQGFVDGPFANGGDRFGIRIDTPFTGVSDGGKTIAIKNSGTINVVGENSAGILVDTDLTGDIVSSGSITIIGGNKDTSDISYGIHATGGTITGNVTLTGSISATGQNVIALALDNGAKGAVSLGMTIANTGYRVTTRPSPQQLSGMTADQMLEGGPGVYVGGNVDGGVNVVAPVTAIAATPTTPAVTGVARGQVLEYGSAPAILIGGPGPITISDAGTGDSAYGLIVGGTAGGFGVFDDRDTRGVQIGGTNPLAVSINGVGPGLSFGSVSMGDGISVTGTATALAYSHTPGMGNATALLVGAGATAPTINVSGFVTATGAVDDHGAPSIAAVKIDTGGSVSSLVNSGQIIARIVGSTALNSAGQIVPVGGESGTVTAIEDKSGTLTSITNTNEITAVFKPANGTGPVTGQAIAMDLRANTVGVIVTQSAFVPTSTDQTAVTPSITGDVLFGSGSATLDLEAGTLTGAVAYGASTGNVLKLDNGASMTGALTQASGGALAVNVADGKLSITNIATVDVSSLNVGSSGEIDFTGTPSGAHGVNGQFNVNVAGAVSIAAGAKIGLNLTALQPANFIGQYTVIQASTSGDQLELKHFTLGATPYLYQAMLDWGVPNALTIDVTRKTAAELGFNPAETAAYEAIYAALPKDSALTTDMLSKTNRASFIHAYDQFLPDYAGGPFETLGFGQQAVERAQAEAPLKQQDGERRSWVQEIGGLDHGDNGQGAHYNGAGFGVAIGVEQTHGDAAIGASGAFLTTRVDNSTQPSQASLTASAFEVGVYWRSGITGLAGVASINGGLAWFDSRRLFLDQTDPSNPVVRTASSHWNGELVAGRVGLSYQSGGQFYLRPELSVDAIALYENAHTEHGGGDAYDLTIKARTSTQTAAQADLVLGAVYGEAIKWRPELMLGWRGVLAGQPGVTTAQFASGGASYTLKPNFQDKGDFLARLGLRAMGSYADFSADAGGQFRTGYQTYDARALARFLF